MGLRSLIPLRGAFWKAQHGKLLRVKKEGHDVVAQVEWADGMVTYMGADFEPGDNIYVLENGLRYKVVGKGAEPVSLGGVPMVRIYSEVVAPISKGAAIAAGFENDDAYDRVDENGNILDEADGSVSMDDSAGPQAVRTDGAGTVTGGPADAFGGGSSQSQKADDHRYKSHMESEESDNPIHGYAYSLHDAAEYAPYPVDPMEYRDAEERGIRAASNRNGLKMLFLGIGLAVGMLILLAVIAFAAIKILGLGGGGGGGSNTQTIKSGALLLVTASRSGWLTRIAREHANRLRGHLGAS